MPTTIQAQTLSRRAIAASCSSITHAARRSLHISSRSTRRTGLESLFAAPALSATLPRTLIQRRAFATPVEPDPNAKKPKPPPGQPENEGKNFIPKGFENFFDNPNPESQRKGGAREDGGAARESAQSKKNDDGSAQEEDGTKRQQQQKSGNKGQGPQGGLS